MHCLRGTAAPMRTRSGRLSRERLRATPSSKGSPLDAGDQASRGDNARPSTEPGVPRAESKDSAHSPAHGSHDIPDLPRRLDHLDVLGHIAGTRRTFWCLTGWSLRRAASASDRRLLFEPQRTARPDKTGSISGGLRLHPVPSREFSRDVEITASGGLVFHGFASPRESASPTPRGAPLSASAGNRSPPAPLAGGP